MGLIDADDEQAAQRPLPFTLVPSKPRRMASEIEVKIGQLYLGTQQEPIPLRLLTVLRGGQTGSKA